MINTGKHIGVRLREADYLILKKVCDARGEDVSNFVRRAIKVALAQLSFYGEEEKKALGILTKPTKLMGGSGE